MALTAVTNAGLVEGGGRATTDQLDLSNILAEVLLNDTDFLSKISSGDDATQTTHTWIEDSENSHQFTLDDTGGTTIIGSNSEATMLVVPSAPQVRLGTLLLNQSQTGADPEVMQVITINTAGSSFEVERGYGGTTAVTTHTDNDIMLIVGSPKLEADDASVDISKARTNGVNFTEIFEKAIKISGTILPLSSAGVGSEWAHQTGRRMLELRKDIALAVIMSNSNDDAAAGSTVETRSIKGLTQFIVDANVTALIVDASSGALSLNTHVNPLTTALWDLGAFNQGSPAVCLVNSFNQRQISAFDSNKQRFTEDSRMAGRFVQFILTDIGQQLEVVVDRFTQLDKVFIVDMGRISLHTLQGRGVKLEELAKTGDFRRAQLLTELTLEVRNAAQAHGFIHSTTTS